MRLKAYLMDQLRQRAVSPAAQDWIYKSPEDLITRKGLEFRPSELAPTYKRGIIKRCFTNSLKLVKKHKDLIYCEGFAVGTVGVHLHAWACAGDNICIDTTWEYSPDKQYLGIPFRTEFIVESLNKRDAYGVLDWWEDGWPLLSGKIALEDVVHPGFQLPE